MAIVNGTSGDDSSVKTLNGTDLADQIYGLGGNDTLVGFGGDDLSRAAPARTSCSAATDSISPAITSSNAGVRVAR